MTRGGTRIAIFLLAALVGAVPVASSGKVPAEGLEEPSLTMEELEVRGRREKPDELYLPVPGELRHPAPIRFDLFREDMTRPILPGEIHGPIQP